MYDEYVGITQHVDALIERCRVSPSETKCDILARVLPRDAAEPAAVVPPRGLDLGEGVPSLPPGEKLYLFLFRDALRQQKPDAVAEVGEDGGLYLDGKKVRPSKGSSIHPAMQMVQERLGHRNAEGQLVSRSAWRQWYVERGERYVRLLDLKDPAKAKKRGGRLYTTATLEELGL